MKNQKINKQTKDRNAKRRVIKMKKRNETKETKRKKRKNDK